MNIKNDQIIKDYDILASIWILACNDEMSQMTYEGIKYRLGLENNYDVKALIHSRGELFRKKTQQAQLALWIDDMLKGNHRPSWIRDILDEKERIEKIKTLTVNDVFRSQFRSEANSPRSEIEIINWGLQHIERLRNVAIEAKQEKTRKFTSVWLPILSTLVAVTAVVCSFLNQYTSNKEQEQLKHYEIEFKPRQEGYSTFMKFVLQAYYRASKMDKKRTDSALDNLEGTYYNIEPFLSLNHRDSIWNLYQYYTNFCYLTIERNKKLKDDVNNSFPYSLYPPLPTYINDQLKADSLKIDSCVNEFIEFKHKFNQDIYTSLFSKETLPAL